MRSDLDQLVGDIRRKQFHVDCIQMELIRASDSKKFQGPGYIQQKPNRNFEIKIYTRETIDFRDAFLPWLSSRAGVLYGPSDHYSLSAIDSHHRRWRAERIVQPGTDGHVGREGIVVSADCQEVVLIEERYPEQTKNVCALASLESIEFPKTGHTTTTIKVGESRERSGSHRNVAELSSNQFSFCFEDDNGLTVNLDGNDLPLPTRLEARVTEAINFALGKTPLWTMVLRSEGKESTARFRSHETKLRRTTQWSPYAIQDIDSTNSTWQMFDRYLTYVLRDDTSQTHPLSLDIFGIAQTRHSSVEGQALAVAVAVESILSRFYSTTAIPDAAFLDEVDRLYAYLDKWDGDSKLKSRALGSLGGLKQIRPDDRLRVLLASGAVGLQEWKAWKKLRNTVAHGDWHKYDENFQELLDLTGKVTGLVNQLIFNLIGYAGKQTDYGTHGWPIIDYPPAKAEAATDVPTTGQGSE